MRTHSATRAHASLLSIQVGAAQGGKWLAFFVRLRALDSAELDVLPSTWSDNFISLHADESLDVTLEYEAEMTVTTVVAEAFNK